MFGESSFETNPSFEEGQEAAASTGANGRSNGFRPQNAPDADEERTAASNSSQESDVEPSFFIIPPQGNDIFRDQRRLPWEKISTAKNGTLEGSAGAAADTLLSITPSGTYNIFGAYRRDRLVRDIDTAGERGSDGHVAILKTLKRAGILIFIIDSKVSSSVADIMDSVQNVITHTRKVQRESTYKREFEEDVDFGKIPRGVCNVASKNQWCLLYRDPDGRLFNLTLAPYTTALAGRWEDVLQSFSVLQAVTILAVLSRSFSCSTSETSMSSFGPAYLAMILGLVFSEELSLSWINVGMFIRGFPSISAYEIMTQVESDWLRKALLLCLSVASAATGSTRNFCTLGGIALASCILLANLGSRSWRFMGWKPAFTGDSCLGGVGGFCGLQSLLEPFLSYTLAILTGVFLPYLGHQKAEMGGIAAVESIFRIAVIVAGIFLISDRDEVQHFLVIGSGECSQDYVNMAVGGWFCLSLICSLLCLSRKQPAEFWPDYQEPLLVEDHASPVGRKVPHLPDFPIDPTYAAKSSRRCINVKMELLMGVIGALGIGGFFVYLGFTGFDDQFLDVSVST